MSTDGKSGSPSGLPLTRVEHERFKATLLSARMGVLLMSAQRQAIRDVLQAAGARTKKPEQCVIAFKALINEAANEIGMPLGRERSNMLDRFVSTFIEEMYRMEGQRGGDDDSRATTASPNLPASATPAENRESPGARH
jgi:hypothetical protein